MREIKKLMIATAVLFGLAAGQATAKDKIGFIYVGPAADYGYNMSMDFGREAMKSLDPKPETTVFESIPESAEVARIMERLVASGHNIIFATSYGYLDYVLDVAKRHPKVSFLHAGGMKLAGNVGTYWADSDDGMYLAGMVAGSQSKSGKLGFVGAFQIPQLFRSINAFTLGAQSVNPNATTTVVWTGGWWEPQKEAEAVNAFADAGIDVIAEQVDSPITIAQTAEKRGVFVIGKDVNVKDRAPKAWLTGVSWNWAPMMTRMVEEIRAGSWKASHVRGDLASGAAVLDPFGDSVPESVRAKVMAAKEDVLAKRKIVWSGPIAKQDGTTVLDTGKSLTREEIETMNYLVKGVVGSAK